MTHLDLFSGIGGFALAANRCGYETIAFCEHDEFCKRVLRKHWPTVSIFGDIHDLDGTQFKGVRLLTGGFPCQPYSNAGLKRGADDDRAIWPQMLRIIAEARPSYVLGENVAGIINMELDDVLFALEAQDYATQAFIVPACAVDAKHRRDRVWILGADTMANPASGELDGGTNKPGGESQRGVAFDGTGEALADAVSKRGRGRNPQRENATDVGQPSSIEGKWSWNPDTDVCRVANGIPNRVHRLRGLGNAIVSQVAEEIIRAIPE